jgi:hypothetical protein
VSHPDHPATTTDQIRNEHKNRPQDGQPSLQTRLDSADHLG